MTDVLFGLQQEFPGFRIWQESHGDRKRYVAWHEGKTKDPTLESLIEGGDTTSPGAPPEQGRAIILTSGTTGTPKGASRSMPKSIDPIAALREE